MTENIKKISKNNVTDISETKKVAAKTELSANYFNDCIRDITDYEWKTQESSKPAKVRIAGLEELKTKTSLAIEKDEPSTGNVTAFPNPNN